MTDNDALARFSKTAGHDIMNLFATVDGFARLIEAGVQGNADQLENVGKILETSERGIALCKQFLAFGQTNALELKNADAGQELRALEEALQGLLGPSVPLKLRLEAGPLRVRISPVAFGIVVKNLAILSKGVLGPGDSVSIEGRLSTEQERRCVRVSVSDTGPGLDPSLAGQLFEPFFLTKQLKRGLGLEAAVAERLVKQMGGTIEAETSSRGLAFHLSFPEAAP